MAHDPFGDSLQSFQNTMAGIFGGPTQPAKSGVQPKSEHGTPPAPTLTHPMTSTVTRVARDERYDQNERLPPDLQQPRPVYIQTPPGYKPENRSRPVASSSHGSISDPLGEVGLIPSESPPSIPFPASQPARAVQVNAELRELLMKNARALSEAEERALVAKEENNILRREISILRGSRPAGEELQPVDEKLRDAEKEVGRLRREVESKERALQDKDDEVKRLTALCKQIGEEHEAAVRDANELLDSVDQDARTVAEQKVTIQRLRAMLENMSGLPLNDIESQRMQAELNRHKSVIETLELKLAHAQESAKGRQEQDEGVLEQLRKNGTIIKDQSREIGRLSDLVRVLKAEKDSLSKAIQPEPTSNADKDQTRRMKDQLLQNAVVISRLEDELKLAKMSSTPLGPEDETRTRGEMEEEILRLRERNTMLEVEAKAYATSVFSLRDELWQAMVVNRQSQAQRDEGIGEQIKSLQKVRQKQGL